MSQDGYEDSIPDMRGVSIQEVVDGHRSPILESAERIYAQLDDPDGVLSAFSSFLDVEG